MCQVSSKAPPEHTDRAAPANVLQLTKGFEVADRDATRLALRLDALTLAGRRLVAQGFALLVLLLRRLCTLRSAVLVSCTLGGGLSRKRLARESRPFGGVLSRGRGAGLSALDRKRDPKLNPDSLQLGL